MRLTNANAFQGTTTINAGTLVIDNFQNAGVSSNLGAGTGNIVLGSATTGGTLRFVGTAGVNNSSTLNLTLGQASGTLDASGVSGTPFVWTSAAAITLTGTTPRTFTLTGTNTDLNVFTPAIVGSGAGATSVLKTGAGVWSLAATASSYTGATTVSAGTLKIALLANGGLNSSLGAAPVAAANLLIDSNASLEYNGTTNTSSNRLFTLGNGTVTLSSTGTGTATFAGPGSVAFLNQGVAGKSRADRHEYGGEHPRSNRSG